MNEAKKMVCYAVGGMVLAIGAVYFAMPKRMKKDLKDMVCCMMSKESCTCPTCDSK